MPTSRMISLTTDATTTIATHSVMLLLLATLFIPQASAIAVTHSAVRTRPLFLTATNPAITSTNPTAVKVFSEQDKRALDADFLKIAAPAFVQFAAEPLARLIDTAYLGRLGKNALGGAGAAIAAQYSVSKLYNDPLLRTTISIVAAQEGASPEERADAVSTALVLALFVGVAQGLAFFLLAGPVLSAMSVTPASPMRHAALGYLRVCSLGAPAGTLWLAANGIFRGLGDTVHRTVCSERQSSAPRLFDSNQRASQNHLSSWSLPEPPQLLEPP